MKPALLVIDMQKAFLRISPETTQSCASASMYINAAIALFREHGLPIVCVQHVNEGQKLVPGEEGFECQEALHLLPSDIYVHKSSKNAFHRTALTETLRAQGVDTVIVTGFAAEQCVLSTYRAAEDLDLTPIVLRGSLASPVTQNIPFVESINNLISTGVLRKVLE